MSGTADSQITVTLPGPRAHLHPERHTLVTDAQRATPVGSCGVRLHRDSRSLPARPSTSATALSSTARTRRRHQRQRKDVRRRRTEPVTARHARRRHRDQSRLGADRRRHGRHDHRNKPGRGHERQVRIREATNVHVVSSTQITATSPAGSGTVDVTVTTRRTTSRSAANQYTYVSAPASRGSARPRAGRRREHGHDRWDHLAGATAVKFGTASATITADTATSITATAPAGCAGIVDVTVTTSPGTSPTSAADHIHLPRRPDRDRLNPTSGPDWRRNRVRSPARTSPAPPTIKFGAIAATNISARPPPRNHRHLPRRQRRDRRRDRNHPRRHERHRRRRPFTYTAPQPSSPPPVPPPSSPPVVSGGAPPTETINGAAVSGTVNPESLATTAFFQYGLDPSDRGPGASTTLYDQSTPVQTVGADSASHTVSASLTGLVPGALYHVRLVATNSDGTTFGTDATFTTPQAPPPAPPVLGKTQDAAPVTGRCSSNRRQAVRASDRRRQIPSGAEIDAIHGSLKITTATDKKGKTQQGVFGGAVFTLTQARGGANKGLATLSLVEGASAARRRTRPARRTRPSTPPPPRARRSSCSTPAPTASSAPTAATAQRPCAAHLDHRRPLRRDPHPRHHRLGRGQRLRPPQDNHPPRRPELPRQGGRSETGRR